MTQPQTLNVEKEELLARAAELEANVPGLPMENPQAPCALSIATDAASQLRFSADAMRLYLSVGDRERRRLAESLRNAAKYYEDADQEAAESVTDDTTVDPVTPQALERTDVSMLGDTVRVSAEPAPYYPVRQAVVQIVAPDQGGAFDRFATSWTAYQRTLLDSTSRFRPFLEWDGTATSAVETSFDLQRAWLYVMADLCGRLATQARNVASAHRWAVTQHPTAAQLAEIDKAWTDYQGNSMLWPQVKQLCLQRYAEMQTKSEEVLTEYGAKASLPLTPVNPPKPPEALRIDPPPTPPPPVPEEPEEPENPEDPEVPEEPELPEEPEVPEDEMPDDGIPDDGLPPTPVTPPTPPTPSTPTTPTADTSKSDEALAKAMSKLSDGPNGLPGGDASLKPASVGAGGGGGVPSIPSLGGMGGGAGAGAAESAAGAASSAGRDAAASAARAMAGAGGGAGGGGMGGMAPMAPGAGGQGGGQDSKTKSKQGEEALYEEDRPWTEAVIGNRRRKDATDNK